MCFWPSRRLMLPEIGRCRAALDIQKVSISLECDVLGSWRKKLLLHRSSDFVQAEALWPLVLCATPPGMNLGTCRSCARLATEQAESSAAAALNAPARAQSSLRVMFCAKFARGPGGCRPAIHLRRALRCADCNRATI